MVNQIAATVSPVVSSPTDPNDRLRAVSQQLEEAFLSEMLKHAGLGTTGGSFSGGIGEEQFSSFLRAEQARAMVASGGLGLSEHLFQALVRRSGAA